MGRYDEADDILTTAETTLQVSPGSNDRQLQAVALARADILKLRGDVVAARRLTDAELQRLDYPNRKDAPGLSVTLRIAAEIALADKQAELAEEFANEYHALAVKAARDPRLSSNVGYSLLLRAKARLMQGKDVVASEDLRQAEVSLVNGLGNDHPETVEVRELLADLGGA